MKDFGLSGVIAAGIQWLVDLVTAAKAVKSSPRLRVLAGWSVLSVIFAGILTASFYLAAVKNNLGVITTLTLFVGLFFWLWRNRARFRRTG